MRYLSIPFSALAVAAAALCFPLAPARAQELAPAPQQQQQAPIVRQIDIQYAGSATVSREKILANMRTAIGKPYSQQAVEDDIRSLYATGSITNVRIFGEPVADGVKVVVVVQSKANVTAINIDGSHASSVRKKLKKDITTKQGQTLNEATLEQDRQKILDEYANKGYSDTTVQYHTDVNDQTGAATVTFTVVEGGKQVVKRIEFEGNTVFTQKQLKKVIKTKTANPLSFLTKAGRVNTDELDDDVTTLRAYYQNHGYEDVTVKPPRIEPDGKRPGHARLRHRGRRPIPRGQCRRGRRAGFHQRPGRRPSSRPSRAESSRRRICGMTPRPWAISTAAAAISTWRSMRRPPRPAPGTINVNYKIDEGSQSYIDRINIEGNTRTKDKVIRRELAVNPGRSLQQQPGGREQAAAHEPELLRQGSRRADLSHRYRHPRPQGCERARGGSPHRLLQLRRRFLLHRQPARLRGSAADEFRSS